jgi:hypothetical protein
MKKYLTDILSSALLAVVFILLLFTHASVWEPESRTDLTIDTELTTPGKTAGLPTKSLAQNLFIVPSSAIVAE